MYEHDPLTHRIIGCAIEVHKILGPGLFENTYEEALCIELKEADLSFTRQIGVPVLYKGLLIGEHRPDLVVENRVVVEVKCVECLAPIHEAQLLVYMRILRLPVGLLINFNTPVVKAGIRRLAL
jgi:GxxExxY protein